MALGLDMILAQTKRRSLYVARASLTHRVTGLTIERPWAVGGWIVYATVLGVGFYFGWVPR